jgi:urease accessory protein UreF
LGTAQIKDADAAVSAAAEEIAVLCGNLPLFLTICGGVIAGYEGDPSWKTEVVGMLVEDRVGLIEDSTGDRTVERLVDSSLSMLKDEQTSLVFMALGVCPEDVLVELPVARLICGTDADVVATGKLSSMSMRRIVKTLLDRHLLQGSFTNGVQMHDIVRDLVRSRLGGEGGIRLKQRVLVAAFAAACPADGCAADDAVGQYVEQALQTHMLEALLPSPLDDVDAQAWLLHANELIVTNAATAFGSAALEALSASKQGAGDLVGAARVVWAARLVKGLSAASSTELAYRTTDFLESANDPSCAEFEVDVLSAAYFLDISSERHTHAQNRRVTVLTASGTETFQSKFAMFMAEYMKGFMAWSYWTPPRPLADVRAAQLQIRQSITIGVEACGLSDIPCQRHVAALCWPLLATITAHTCDMDDWNPELCGGEAALVEAMEHWTKTDRKCGLEAKADGTMFSLNLYLWGTAPRVLALYFGRVSALVQWAKDAVADYNALDLRRTRDYLANSYEIMHGRVGIQLLVNLGRPAEAFTVLDAMGFTWSDDGFALYDVWFSAMTTGMPGFAKDADAVWQRLLLYAASPQSAALDAEVGAWIPAPAAIAQHERDETITQFLYMGMLGLAASVFLRLDRDDEAAEAARILVSPEHGCLLQNDLAHGHGVLGQVAAKRGDVEAAGGHFGRALQAATASRFPLWEVIAARDWKRAVPASGAAADAAIDAACAKMGKTRAELELAL